MNSQVNSPTLLLKLQTFLKRNTHLNDKDIDQFLTIWKPYDAKRKVTLTNVGENEKYLYFVNDGVQRIYFTDETGREATILFTYAPSFGGVVDSFMLQQPSRFYYETLTRSSFLRAPYSVLFELAEKNPSINNMIRDLIAAALSGLLERLVELQCFSSEEKFKVFMQRSPHMLQLVPHKYLANYIGIDATNFSKLVNRVKF